MKIFETNLTKTVFGDVTLSLYPDEIRGKTSNEVFHLDPFYKLKQAISSDAFVFLHQTHGNQGSVIKSRAQADMLPLFTLEGDFLVTNVNDIALGVVTADCLPIIAIDPVMKVIGIAHAGWRGSAANIVQVMLEAMQNEYRSTITNLLLQFGPSAGPCCYEVQPSFLEELKDHSIYPPLISQAANYAHRIGNKNTLYFDLPEFNRYLALDAGINACNITLDTHICTICSFNYISIRRSKTAARQITAVSLK